MNIICIQYNCAIESVKASARRSTRIERDGGQRQDVPRKLGVRSQHGRATDLPEDAAGLCAIDNRHLGIACCCKGAAYLEDEDTVRITLAIQGQLAGELS
jgi:hypothetical protein